MKNKFQGTPLGPLFSFCFFYVLFLNKRGLARLLKLCRVFILTQKGDNSSPKILGTPFGLPEGVFYVFFSFF